MDNFETPLIVKISTKTINRFKKMAKKVFPSETFCYLLGEIINNKYIIRDIYFPKDVKKYCTPDIANIQDHWEDEVKIYAQRKNLKKIGDLHNHSYTYQDCKSRKITDLSPSEQDWERDNESCPIMGICLIKQRKDGKLYSKIKFWGPLQKVVLRET